MPGLIPFAYAYDAVKLAALNLRGHIENLDRLPKPRPPETMALHRSHLADLINTARLLSALRPHESAISALLEAHHAASDSK